MLKTGNVGILEAVEVMKQMSLSKRLRRAYEARVMAARDRWAEDEYVRRQGITEGKAEDLLLILESKGKVSPDLRVRILSENNFEKLDKWVRQALSCASVEEFASNLDLEK